MNSNCHLSIWPVLLGSFLLGVVAPCSAVTIVDDARTPQTTFAVKRIKAALTSKLATSECDGGGNEDVRNTIVLVVDSVLVPEGYRIVATGTRCSVVGSNPNEAMYGGLELAESLRFGEDIWQRRDIIRKPYIARRGIKFNIPLDARTPSYDDSGDAAQKNIKEMWDFEFWSEMIDQMATHRYNVLTFWNPHPFPSMTKMEDYPEVALDDVCVTTLTPSGKENEWGEPQLVSENVIRNLKVVKRMTIDEKISFWQKVMQRANDRGIDVYFVTWNICPNSVALPVKENYRTYGINVKHEQPGKYGVTHQIDNDATIRYLRASVKQFLVTYPHVKGIGVTAGEHMPKDWSGENREEWLWKTYGLGILDAKRETPNRKVDFIHRVWYTDLDEVMKYWSSYPDRFELSFKYAKARLYSSTQVPFARQQIEEMQVHGLKSWWNLRNDDIFVHRWGDPEYVRDFISNFELEHTAGYYLGSDGYVWGREFLSRSPEEPREIEISKHWYQFMLWGRLGYDPTLSRTFFEATLKDRFPNAPASLLYETWKAASKIIPQVNRFYWQNWDHMWSVESCRGHVEGFHEVTKFCDHRPMQGSNIISIREFVRTNDEIPDSKTSPLEVAERLDELAEQSMEGAAGIKDVMASKNIGLSRQLDATLGDVRSMAWLGRFYADKIRAAVELAYFEETNDREHLVLAIQHMKDGFEDCERYVELGKKRYHSQMLARPGKFDWDEMLSCVANDVRLLEIRDAKKRTSNTLDE